MHPHCVRVIGLAAAAIVVLAAAPLDAQALKTAWGDPDLQGTWTNQTLTPLERPAEFAGKPVLTEEEARAYEARLRQQNNADIRTPGTRRDVTVAYNDAWWDLRRKYQGAWSAAMTKSTTFAFSSTTRTRPTRSSAYWRR